jgi:hypothetical protein
VSPEVASNYIRTLRVLERSLVEDAAKATLV